MARMVRHRGHVLNWYDTNDLRPLDPQPGRNQQSYPHRPTFLTQLTAKPVFTSPRVWVFNVFLFIFSFFVFRGRASLIENNGVTTCFLLLFCVCFNCAVLCSRHCFEAANHQRYEWTLLFAYFSVANSNPAFSSFEWDDVGSLVCQIEPVYFDHKLT